MESAPLSTHHSTKQPARDVRLAVPDVTVTSSEADDVCNATQSLLATDGQQQRQQLKKHHSKDSRSGGKKHKHSQSQSTETRTQPARKDMESQNRPDLAQDNVQELEDAGPGGCDTGTSSAPPSFYSGTRHVPFSGLTLSSGINGVTYQHTVGGYSTTAGAPLIRVRGRMNTRKLTKRVVFKGGDLNVVQGNLSKRRRRYLADIVTTLVDIKWRWTLLVFTMSFLISWLVFAVIWWLIGVSHGDFETNNINDPNYKSCVPNVKDFTGCFLFSLETQQTIGYGFRYISDKCAEAVVLICIQSIAGLIIQALMVSVVFTKLARPKKRAQTLMFSRNAVICQRDGKLCLMFRLGNMRTSSLVGASARAQIIRKRITPEGETLQFDMEELNLGPDDGQDSILFIWPLNVVHTIDDRSPLYQMSAEDLLHKERFEIVVMLEGSTESTAMTTQARSSYIPSEILWGHRFEPIIDFKRETGAYQVDYSRFNSTYEVDTPLCSAAELDMFRRKQTESAQSTLAAVSALPPMPARGLTSGAGFNNFDILRSQADRRPKGD